MRKLLMFASVAAMAVSMPAVTQAQDRGKAAQGQNDRAKARANVQAKAKANARADRNRAQARTQANARVKARATPERQENRARVAANARADANRAEQRREEAARDRAQEQRQAQARNRAQEQRQAEAARERLQDRRQQQQRVANRDRIEDRREQQQSQALRERLENQRQQQQRVAARERLEDRRQQQRREVRRERIQDQRQLQRRLAARDRWQDRQRFYAQQAQRYRLASYRQNNRDYRYLYRNVSPNYFRSASNFYPIGRSAPPAWAPAWGRRAQLPYRYRDIYYDTPNNYYRYDDGYIYRVNASTNLVADVIPLLGGGFAVGQLMPVGYDAYNVPYQYRDYYYDTDDAYYRYGDGGIYQVDPTTGMIQAVVALLAGDLNVGQTLPIGYSAYNLPYQYRSQYVDNGDYMYRYNDGYIYRADAETRLIQSIIPALV